MIISQLHEWHVTPAKAISIQKELASKICVKETLSNIYFIAGVDVAIYGRSEGTASIVVLNYPELQLVDHSSVRGTVDFPYVPGLLSFREIPLLFKAFECLKINPDLILVDGQGFAHPRRFGLASHLGLLLDLPTIGCAKSRLCGTHQEPGIIAGSTSDLVDTDEIIGSVVRTKSGTRPVYVSIGYKVSLEQAVEWTLKCCRGFRLPEPTRLAHQAAGGFLHQAVCSN